MARLIVLQGGEAVRYDLKDDEVVIGRHPDCTVKLDSNMVSRRHAQLIRQGDAYLVEDLGSGNGTFVNGKKIEGRTKLNHEDRIKLGPMLLRYESESAPRPSLVAPTSRPLSNDPLGPTASFRLNLASGEEDSATIMSAMESPGGFGMLEVQPEVKLKAVIEIARNLAGTVELEKLLPRILDTLFRIFPHADRGSILLKDMQSGQLIPSAQKHRRESEDSTVKLSRTIVNKVLTEKTGVLSADAANDAQFQASESISSLTIRSMMCVPMLGIDGNPLGIINIDTQNPLNQFKKDDLDLLMAVAGQAAMSYESARLLVSFMERKKQESELQIARGVQLALLPPELPKTPGYDFYASYDAAQAVGGDYYDAMLLGEDKICLAFGDVAGKGVPGALIMSRISSCVQNTMQFVSDAGEAAAAINNHMCANMVEGRFVTFILCLIDLKTHDLAMVNAGHMSPMILRPDGTIEEFPEESVGLPIGVMQDYPYDVVHRKIEPGDLFVLFTDGVDEAMNPAGDLYTLERMRDLISKGPRSATELGKALLADVRRHANGRPQNDDITIMTFSRNT